MGFNQSVAGIVVLLLSIVSSKGSESKSFVSSLQPRSSIEKKAGTISNISIQHLNLIFTNQTTIGLLDSFHDYISENCHIKNDFKSGGLDCPGNIHANCINQNIGYSDLAAAWKRCGELPECGKIMKYTDGKYYLRRATDPACCSQAQHVDYRCPRNEFH